MSLPLSKRVALATDYAILLFIPALGVGILTALRSDVNLSTLIRIGVTCSVPAAATVILAALLVLVPSLMADGQRAGWLTVTLPLVYASVLAAGLVLAFSGANPLIRPPLELQPALAWLQPATLLFTVLAQVALLAIRHVFAKPDRVST